MIENATPSCSFLRFSRLPWHTTPSRRFALNRLRNEDSEVLLRLNSEVTFTDVDISDAMFLTGAIGPALQQLTSLVRLNVSVSKFDDEGVACLASCPSLAELLLIATPITTDSGVHIAALSKTLRVLDVSETTIDDSFFTPLAEASMPMLESLSLLNCNTVTGSCTKEIATFRGLTLLKMGLAKYGAFRSTSMTSETFGTAEATALAKLPRIEELWVPRMYGGDATVAELLPFAPRLTSLNLLRHDITNSSGATLAQLTRLRWLTLAHCGDITDGIGIHLGALTSLELLDLSGCKGLTNNIAPHLLPLRSLTLVIFSGCPRIGVKAAEILQPLPKLDNVLLDFGF